jgi:ubiquinone/menaquinone biosynthesis C-methylase UbiE
MHDFDEATRLTLETYQEISGLYANTHTVAQAPNFWRERMQRFVELVKASPAYQKSPSLPVLDLGCGPGRDSILLAQEGFNVLGADISEAMLDEARKRCQHLPNAERITFRRMDMHALDLPDASCAGIWLSASFLHIPKRENLQVMKGIVRVLVPGGPLQMMVKECDEGADERYEVHKESGKTRFFARYSGSELWALLEQAGLQVEEILTDVDRRFQNLQRWLGALAVKNEIVDVND